MRPLDGSYPRDRRLPGVDHDGTVLIMHAEPASTRGDGAQHRWWLRTVALSALLVGLALSLAGPGRAADAGGVYLVDISGEIDLGLAPFLDRVVREAEAAGAAAVVLDIDTPGGRLDAVLQMRDSLLDTPVRIVAFVDRTALSAGALIALSSDDIYLAPGSVLGAATPVDGTGVAADEKVISAVRSLFRSTAEQQGRDPEVAEAMVDPVVAIDGVVARGELLTLTVSEAEAVGYADGTATDLTDLLGQLGFEDQELIEAGISPAERVARLVSNPLVASLLLAAGVLLLIGDLLSGGVGVGAAAGIALLGLFFGGHHVAGLAGWEDAALIGIGVLLLLLEVFVLPGIGIAGVAGLAAILGGGFLATLGRDFDLVGADQLLRAGLTVGFALVLIVGGLIGLMTYLTRKGGPDRLVLSTALGDGTPVTQRSSRGWLGWFDVDAVLASDRDEFTAGPAGDGRPTDGTRDGPGGETPGATAAPRSPAHLPRPDARAGATGVALTDLRPAGVAEIAGQRVDVVTEGEYLRAGDPVEVLVDEGYRRVVRRGRS
jgi:membrane-bound serine protease (ClpP class)